VYNIKNYLTNSVDGECFMSFNIQFVVNSLAIGYAADLRGELSLGLPWAEWKEIFTAPHNLKKKHIEAMIPQSLKKEAHTLKSGIEDTWRTDENKVLNMLEKLTKWKLPDLTVRICVVPFHCSRVPFPGIPLIVLGYIRGGWHYPETIAHELAHILFNYYTDFDTARVHPFIQLIEEEIAVRLGLRSGYFAYDIPPEALWIKRAQKMLTIWKEYLAHGDKYNNITDLVNNEENL